MMTLTRDPRQFSALQFIEEDVKFVCSPSTRAGPSANKQSKLLAQLFSSVAPSATDTRDRNLEDGVVA
jgi:hypothetical protein